MPVDHDVLGVDPARVEGQLGEPVPGVRDLVVPLLVRQARDEFARPPRDRDPLLDLDAELRRHLGDRRGELGDREGTPLLAVHGRLPVRAAVGDDPELTLAAGREEPAADAAELHAAVVPDRRLELLERDRGDGDVLDDDRGGGGLCRGRTGNDERRGGQGQTGESGTEHRLTFRCVADCQPTTVMTDLERHPSSR
nr:hypothetical protein [Herbidospora yilanensis]